MARNVDAQQLTLPGLDSAAVEPRRPQNTPRPEPPTSEGVAPSRPVARPVISPAEHEPTLLTTQEAALRLRVHPRTVQRLVERGELPAIHIGAAVRFDPVDVVELTARSRYRVHSGFTSVAERVRATHAIRVSFADRLRSRGNEHRADQA
ncbi:MAG TPA: helix-turn-helix domain-containing protein [Gaiellaceae bacterium]|nr:helix-turn-helix domain-containing protein [Gaiellaceae bacterium]